MDFPEMKYHDSGEVPCEYWASVRPKFPKFKPKVEDEDTSDNPTVIIPRPLSPPPPIEDRWFYPF